MDTIGGPSAAASTLLLLLLVLPATVDFNGVAGLELGQCMGALGMESGAIKNAAISASSAYDSGSVGPQHGRLRNDKNGGAWCPRHMVSRDAKEYLEIDLGTLHVLTGTKTQGRFGNGQGQEYAEEYMLEYWRPGFSHWNRWRNREGKELLAGNTNTYTMVEQKLDPPLIASKVRFLPYSDHVRTVCMRVEILGCVWRDGLLSYAGPQGIRRGELDLTDRTYDGLEESGQLSRGLGQLVDGQKGQDNFRLDLSGHGKGYEWVGWRNDTPGWAGNPVEMLLEFDKVRNFSAAHLHTNNLFTKDVQVFSHAKAYFSIGGNLFNGEPVHFSYMPDLVLEHARNVTIKLHHRIGRFLKLQLYFSSRWIMLSEMSFDSVPISGNFTDGEEEDNVVIPDAGREYPLQRDEVKSTPTKVNRTILGGGGGLMGGGTSAKSPAGPEEPKHYIGFVIGILTVVILILVAAIVFIVFRNHRLKPPTGHSVIPANDKRLDNEMRMSMDECDKATLYHEPRLNVYTRERLPPSPDYTDVPDIMCQEYAIPSHRRELDPTYPHVSAAGTPSGRAPPLLNFLPKPPPIPPPPERYYAANPVSVPPSPPLSPLSIASKISRHFMRPPGGEDVSDDEEDVKIEEFPREQLRIIEKVGDGMFGDVHLCEVVGDICEEKVVAVHTLRVESLRRDFVKEVRSLAKVKDPHVALLLGACLDSEPVCAVREYLDLGDLNQFLQDHVAESTTPISSMANTLSYGCLIYMATQIASGMKHLETLRYVHKDLATRNCLVGDGYRIKVSDLGPGRPMYAADYCEIAGCPKPLPVRWMAWESVLLAKFTSKSDVWSFAVTLWEILTFAREQPFDELSDDKVIENVTHFYQDNGKHMLLDPPINCPKEIFDLMCECWQRNESDRPNFREIHLFLQRKNLGYKPSMH